jgi:hypothetical protein
LLGVGAAVLLPESHQYAWIRGRCKLGPARSNVEERCGRIENVRLIDRILFRKSREGRGQQE